MTIKIGEFPFVSIMLALSFGVYGLLKKVVHIDAISSIAIECIVTAPAGIIYVIYLWRTSHDVWFQYVIILAYLSGAVTAIPLILFCRSETYTVITNRIYSICRANDYVYTWYLCI